jgi:hypothetical protein
MTFLKCILSSFVVLVALCQSLTSIDLSLLRYVDTTVVLAAISTLAGEARIVECDSLVLKDVYFKGVYHYTLIVLLDKNNKWVAAKQVDGTEGPILFGPIGSYAYWYEENKTLYVFDNYNPNSEPHYAP